MEQSPEKITRVESRESRQVHAPGDVGYVFKYLVPTIKRGLVALVICVEMKRDGFS